MGLATKYRPKTFDELFGNDAIKRAIEASIGKVHCYLLYGSRGCGKTTTARIIASMLGADESCIFELNAADQTGVDDARKLVSTAYLAPIIGHVKVYIIDECHRFTANAQDSLLKILEEPPEHVYFILCTTDHRKVIPTIKSRASAGTFSFSPLSRKDMSGLLSNVMAAEGIDIEPHVMRSIISASGGIPRDALGLLEKVCSVDSVDDAVALARAGTAEDPEVLELIHVIVKRKGWKAACDVLSRLKADPEQVRRAILGYLGKMMLGRDDVVLRDMLEAFEDDYFSSGRAGLILSVFDATHMV